MLYCAWFQAQIRMVQRFIAFILFIVLLTNSFVMPSQQKNAVQILSQKDYSLADRYNNAFVNSVFSDNILLTLAYMRGSVHAGQQVNWNSVKKDFTYTLIIKPGKTFAFHDDVLPQYKTSDVNTTHAHFDSAEGFKYD